MGSWAEPLAANKGPERRENGSRCYASPALDPALPTLFRGSDVFAARSIVICMSDVATCPAFGGVCLGASCCSEPVPQNHRDLPRLDCKRALLAPENKPEDHAVQLVQNPNPVFTSSPMGPRANRHFQAGETRDWWFESPHSGAEDKALQR